MKLSGLTRESVLAATTLIDQQKLSRSQLNSDYQVTIENRSYPFKLLVEKSYKIATDTALPADTFKEYFYLIKQFENFSGFSVKVNPVIALRKFIGDALYIVHSPSFLLDFKENKVLDFSLLGPAVNDIEIKKRRFRNNHGFEEIKPGLVFFLATEDEVYAMVQVINDESVTRPLIPVRSIFVLEQPLLHGIDFSDEPYPLLEMNYHKDYLVALCGILEKTHPQLLEDSIQTIGKASSDDNKS